MDEMARSKPAYVFAKITLTNGAYGADKLLIGLLITDNPVQHALGKTQNSPPLVYNNRAQEVTEKARCFLKMELNSRYFVVKTTSIPPRK